MIIKSSRRILLLKQLLIQIGRITSTAATKDKRISEQADSQESFRREEEK